MTLHILAAVLYSCSFQGLHGLRVGDEDDDTIEPLHESSVAPPLVHTSDVGVLGMSFSELDAFTIANTTVANDQFMSISMGQVQFVVSGTGKEDLENGLYSGSVYDGVFNKIQYPRALIYFTTQREPFKRNDLVQVQDPEEEDDENLYNGVVESVSPDEVEVYVEDFEQTWTFDSNSMYKILFRSKELLESDAAAHPERVRSAYLADKQRKLHLKGYWILRYVDADNPWIARSQAIDPQTIVFKPQDLQWFEFDGTSGGQLLGNLRIRKSTAEDMDRLEKGAADVTYTIKGTPENLADGIYKGLSAGKSFVRNDGNAFLWYDSALKLPDDPNDPEGQIYTWEPSWYVTSQGTIMMKSESVTENQGPEGLRWYWNKDLRSDINGLKTYSSYAKESGAPQDENGQLVRSVMFEKVNI